MKEKPRPRIPAADIGVNADKPHLADALAVDLGQGFFRVCRRRLPVVIDGIEFAILADIAIVPKHRMERVALLLQRQRMTGAADLAVHEQVRHRQRPIPVIDGARDLLDRASIGVDRVPNPEKVNFLDLDQIELLERGLAENGVAHPIAKRPQRPDQDISAPLEIPGLAISAVGYFGVARQIRIVAIVADKADARDEACDHADRERAPAEPKAVDFVAMPVVAAAERIDVDDVALQSEAENAAQDGEWLE